VDRIVRQRTTLLKQSGGRLDATGRFTLDVLDAKLAEAGEALGTLRAQLVTDLEPLLAKAYGDLAGAPGSVRLTYAAPWRRTGLARALVEARDVDVRRGMTSVGPHRDDLDVELNGLPARTHASRGEQRSLALAARLAAHQAVTDRVGEAPVLLLDDVLSELDADRAHALLVHLPPGQVVLTTAGPLPPAAHPERFVQVRGGALA
jgi:DNA replication and repair protein RecF